VLRRLSTSVAFILLLAERAAGEPSPPAHPVREARLRGFWLGVIIPFAILFLLCVISSHMPWKRVRRRRSMPAVIRPGGIATTQAHRSGWRHARALGKYQGGVERPRAFRPWRTGGL
jgi:hypothetical protein